MQKDITYNIVQSRPVLNSYASQEYRKQELTQRISSEIDSELNSPIKDLTYKLSEGLANTAYNIGKESGNYTRKQALEYFDKKFLEREIPRAHGIITELTRNVTDAYDKREVNSFRRNLYRKIDKYGLEGAIDSVRPINIDPMKAPAKNDNVYSAPKTIVDKLEYTMSSTLSGYKGIIHPNIYENMSSQIKEKASVLASKILPYIPTHENRLNQIIEQTEGSKFKEAKLMFEKQFIYDALCAADFDKTKAADYAGDSVQTFNRRLSKLGLDASKEKKEHDNAKAKPEVPTQEIDRFKQLVMEYNSRREAMVDDAEKKKMKKQTKVAA
jgi:hypothetical protein